MQALLPINELVNEWLIWAKWIQDPNRDESESDNLIGFEEFDWTVIKYPEHAWQTILAVFSNPLAKQYFDLLAAGPIEDLLSLHGNEFIERIELEAKSNPHFANALGGMYQCSMTNEIWQRVQAVSNRSHSPESELKVGRFSNTH